MEKDQLYIGIVTTWTKRLTLRVSHDKEQILVIGSGPQFDSTDPCRLRKDEIAPH